METWGYGVEEVVRGRFAHVGVCQVADVALEGGFADEAAETVVLAAVVAVAARYGRVVGFDYFVDAGGAGVEGQCKFGKGVEVGVCFRVEGDEEIGFVGDVGEDEGGRAFPVIPWCSIVLAF